MFGNAFPDRLAVRTGARCTTSAHDFFICDMGVRDISVVQAYEVVF